MGRSRIIRLFVVVAVIALSSAGLVSVHQATVASAASGCGCAGDYVAPSSKSPSVSTPKSGSKSPKGTYTLTVTSTSITVKDAKTSQTLLSLPGLTGDFHAGFSPNDSGFAVWSLDASGGKVSLYDLSAKTPSHIVWSNTYLGAFSLGFSPHGTYFLVAATVNAQFTKVTVVNSTSGSQAYDDQVAGNTMWGFSPDDQRLALWTGTNNATSGSSTSTIILQDLSAGRRVWSTEGAFGAVSLAFSPHGTYLASAAITNGSHADLAVVTTASTGAGSAVVYQSSFDLYGPPGQDKDKFENAAWGFGPGADDSTFLYDAVDGQNGVDVVMVNLTTRAAHPFSFPTVVSGWWQFSPCGDVLGIVMQPSSAASVNVSLYDTSSGQVLTTDQFSSLNVSLTATDAYHVVTVDGTDHNLVKNSGHAGCSDGGGSGSGSGNSGGGSNTGGSGNGSGGTGGGGSSPLPPCPSCYTPSVVITNLQVSPIAVIGGGQLTGTLSTTTGGAVSLSSSDPTAASVPATLNTTSGDNTFTVTTGSVDQDTLVTITAKGGDTTKTARFIVRTNCTTSSPAISANMIAAAPIAGNGGGPGGHSGPVERPSAQVSVSPMVVTAGNTTTGTIMLSDAAKQDTTFTLTSSDTSAATVPAGVTVAQGQKTATFTVTAQDVPADELVNIGAHALGYLTIGTTIAVVRAPSLDSLTLDASSVAGGTSVTGTVTLSGTGASCQVQTIILTTSDANVASVPVSVSVPAGSGSATFTIQTSPVSSDTGVTVSGTLNGTTRSANLTIKAPAPPSDVYNDNIADAASLDIPGSAIGDTNLATMESGEPRLSGTCAVLTAHQLENSVWFKLTSAQSGILTVSTANAGTNFDSVLALYADPGSPNVGSLGTPLGCDNNADALQSTDSASSDLTLRSEEHTGPGGDKGTLGGLPDWSSIMHVAVTAGETYYVQLGGVGGAPAGHYVLTAEINPDVPLPNLLDGVSFDSPSVAGGTEMTGTVTLSAPAPAGGVIVALSSSDETTATVPDAVVVPEGEDHATFAVQTTSVAADAQVTVTTSFDGAQQTANLGVMAP